MIQGLRASKSTESFVLGLLHGLHESLGLVSHSLVADGSVSTRILPGLVAICEDDAAVFAPVDFVQQPRSLDLSTCFCDRSTSWETDHRPGHIHDRRATSRLSTQAHHMDRIGRRWLLPVLAESVGDGVDLVEEVLVVLLNVELRQESPIHLNIAIESLSGCPICAGGCLATGSRHNRRGEIETQGYSGTLLQQY